MALQRIHAHTHELVLAYAKVQCRSSAHAGSAIPLLERLRKVVESSQVHLPGAGWAYVCLVACNFVFWNLLFGNNWWQMRFGFGQHQRQTAKELNPTKEWSCRFRLDNSNKTSQKLIWGLNHLESSVICWPFAVHIGGNNLRHNSLLTVWPIVTRRFVLFSFIVGIA